MSSSAKFQHSEALKNYQVVTKSAVLHYHNGNHHVRIDLRTCTKAEVLAALKANVKFIKEPPKTPTGSKK